jgi:hypothetical protein
MLLTAAIALPGSLEPIPLALPLLVAGSNDMGSTIPCYGGSTIPYGLTPNQVRGAYGLGSYSNGVLSNGITFGAGGIPGDGRGQTIAIVDGYDDPNALSDLNTFSTSFGLPTFGGTGNPTFQKLNQTGGTSLPITDPNGPYSPTSTWSDWEQEESLDIEWTHAMAPLANIILMANVGRRGNEPCLPAVGGDDRDRRRGTRDCRRGVARWPKPDPAGIVHNPRGGRPRHHQRQ